MSIVTKAPRSVHYYCRSYSVTGRTKPDFPDTSHRRFLKAITAAAPSFSPLAHLSLPEKRPQHMPQNDGPAAGTCCRHPGHTLLISFIWKKCSSCPARLPHDVAKPSKWEQLGASLPKQVGIRAKTPLQMQAASMLSAQTRNTSVTCYPLTSVLTNQLTNTNHRIKKARLYCPPGTGKHTILYKFH